MSSRISIDQWRSLPDNDREKYSYVSNEIGCYFEEIEKVATEKNKTDDFERLTKKEGTNNG